MLTGLLSIPGLFVQAAQPLMHGRREEVRHIGVPVVVRESEVALLGLDGLLGSTGELISVSEIEVSAARAAV